MILVTGGSGFIASHLCEQLFDEGYEIKVFDIKKPHKIAHILDKVDFFKGDIRKPRDCREAVKDAESVIHLAALINVDHSIQTPRPFYETNVMGTVNLLEAIRKTESIEKISYMSTCETLGNVMNGRADETHLCDPRSPYASSKYAAERCCLSYYDTYGSPETTVIRGFNTFGPRQSYDARGAAIAIFIMNILRGVPPKIYGDGTQERDYVYVEDMARGVVRASVKRGIGGEIIHLASGRTRTINYITHAILELANSNLSPVHVEPRLGEVARSCGDASKAKRLLNWEIETPFVEGLRRTFEHYKEVTNG